MERKNKSATFTVVFMIAAMFISKVLGMLRGVLLAASYDISEEATAFSAASRIPLSFFDIIFASAILGCFIPVYNSFTSDNKKEKQNEFTSIYLNFLLLLTGLLSILGIVFAKSLLSVVAPGLLPDTEILAVKLLRIMFPLIVFAASSYIFVGLLQSNGEYIVPAFISAVSNLVIILYFIFFDNRFGITGLAVTFTLAWCVQLLTLVLPIKKTRFKYRLLFDFKNPAFLSALKLTPPIIMGSWLSPVCLLVSMRFATNIGVSGAVPSFEYAVNLFTVITGITTYGVCNYIFPKLSEKAGEDKEAFGSMGRTGLISALLMTVPISILVFLLSPQIISVVYMRGSFDLTAAKMVTLILKTLVPGMLGFTLVEFLSRTFYAMKKPKYPVISVVLGIIADVISLSILSNVSELGINSLGISYSIGILTSGVFMFIFASTRIEGFINRSFIIDIAKIIASGILSFAVIYGIDCMISPVAFEKSAVYNVIYSTILAVVGVIVYVLLLLLVKEKTVSDLKIFAKKR